MGFHSTGALVLCCAAWLQCVGSIRHHILTKSWNEAQEDCLAYLEIGAHRARNYRCHYYDEDDLTKELLFCIAVNLRAYEPNRNAVRTEVMVKFFRPDHGDSDHAQRTNECLRQRGLLPTGKSTPRRSKVYSSPTEKVFETFRCFYHHYGNLIGEASPLPLTALELDQVQQDCAQIVGIPQDLLLDRLRLRVHPMSERFRRCVALRSGIPGTTFVENDEGKKEVKV